MDVRLATFMRVDWGSSETIIKTSSNSAFGPMVWPESRVFIGIAVSKVELEFRLAEPLPTPEMFPAPSLHFQQPTTNASPNCGRPLTYSANGNQRGHQPFGSPELLRLERDHQLVLFSAKESK